MYATFPIYTPIRRKTKLQTNIHNFLNKLIIREWSYETWPEVCGQQQLRLLNSPCINWGHLSAAVADTRLISGFPTDGCKKLAPIHYQLGVAVHPRGVGQHWLTNTQAATTGNSDNYDFRDFAVCTGFIVMLKKKGVQAVRPIHYCLKSDCMLKY